MFLHRTAITAAKRAAFHPSIKRSFTTSFIRRETQHTTVPSTPNHLPVKITKLEDVTSEEDLIPPGAPPGTVPTDLEQATGLERLEILGKMQGIDVFDMKPLDASRKGTLDNPIIVKSFGEEQYAGCTGYPADSHVTLWLAMSRDRPLERCSECGNCIKMEYVGPPDDPHAHDHGHGDHGHAYEEPKTMADYVKREYW